VCDFGSSSKVNNFEKFVGSAVYVSLDLNIVVFLVALFENLCFFEKFDKITDCLGSSFDSFSDETVSKISEGCMFSFRSIASTESSGSGFLRFTDFLGLNDRDIFVFTSFEAFSEENSLGLRVTVCERYSLPACFM